MPTATYSPEDNKLRLYVGRVPRDEYERLRDAGFISTPKQSCDFVATWTPAREDLAREYLDDDEDIEDEDYSPEERAADRAERFEGYRDKRRDEAHGHADRFDNGPTVFGHQNQDRAERQATRHDRHRGRAVSQWSKAEYWQTRTAGVISHALHKGSAKVRRGRILTLEAEQRKHEKSREEYKARFLRWSVVASLTGADQTVVRAPAGEYGIDTAASSRAANTAYVLANSSGCYGSDYKHPRTDRTGSIYDLMTDAADPITAAEAAALWLEHCPNPDDGSTHSARWSAHYELRLTYEKAMLENEGGMASEADMEIGGWLGSHQIQKINKSPATGRVVSVQVIAKHHTYKMGSRVEVVGPMTINIERLGENVYRAPTAEDLAVFAEAKQERKTTSPTISLINPTDEDAEKLQALWNKRATAKGRQSAAIISMTQARYSQLSKGDSAATHTVDADGGECRYTNKPAVFKVRYCWRFTGANSLIVITDKPQKSLPLDWSALANPAAPAVETREEVTV